MAFEFKVQKGVEIPPVNTSRGSQYHFPWEDMEAELKKIKDGTKPPYIDVPTEFWLKERGWNKETYKPVKARDRIRSHFRNWQSRDKSRETLTIVTRELPEGIRVWMTKTASE